LSFSFNEDFKSCSWIRWTTRCTCLDIISFCSSIVFVVLSVFVLVE
jgi:hypothetical protein